MSFHLYGYGALVLVCAGLYAWVSIQGARIDTADARISRYKSDLVAAASAIDQAKTVNGENLETIQRLKADLTRQAEVSLRFEDLARVRAAKLNKVLKEISDAPAIDDGPVAPVLARQLGRLHDEFSAAHGADTNPDRAPAGSSQ